MASKGNGFYAWLREEVTKYLIAFSEKCYLKISEYQKILNRKILLETSCLPAYFFLVFLGGFFGGGVRKGQRTYSPLLCTTIRNVLSGVNNSQLALWTVRQYVLPDLANVITFMYKINLMQLQMIIFIFVHDYSSDTALFTLTIQLINHFWHHWSCANDIGLKS